jgi:hypothetical protein
MNGFLNGIMQVWDRLPSQSKSVIVDNLTVKQKNLLNIGSRLVQYYVDINQQPDGQNGRQEEQPQVVEASEATSKKSSRSRRRTRGQEPTRHASNQKKEEEDDDVIEAVWSEKSRN